MKSETKISVADFFLSEEKFGHLFASNDVMKWDDAKMAEFVSELQVQDLLAPLKRRTGMFAAAQPSSMVFNNIVFQDPHSGEYVLRGVSGYFLSGTMCAVIGAPDAHVTELLKLLSGRVRRDIYSGGVYLDGVPPQKDFHHSLGFVPQNDIHLPTLTVFETLYFAAKMRLSALMPDFAIRMRVYIILQRLGLLHVRHTIVGNETLRGVSGGEKRRVSVGIEAVAGHSLLSQICHAMD
eukprot:TRINITY_DN24352_c0_g2_i1.p1 TRINITY_DN24352_c0_g2~~TRINITY_DN24352_c0_g2_i1.p1  ORF type:complete len:237 (+),score=50.54 TRINITY_DN24352_c0_g2_i1:2-712(+)